MPSFTSWLLPLSAIVAMPVAASGDPFAGHLWKSRLLVVIAPNADSPPAREQVRLYDAATAGSRERDLVLVRAFGDTDQARKARERFDVPASEFRAILVGKDGGAKMERGAPIRPEELFEEIDTMPMRQDEMRRGRT